MEAPPVNPFDQWAGLYDWAFAWKQDDIPFYVEEAERSGGPVLELGSGTGRVAIPIARSGVEVVGLESSPGCCKRPPPSPVAWATSRGRRAT